MTTDMNQLDVLKKSSNPQRREGNDILSHVEAHITVSQYIKAYHRNSDILQIFHAQMETSQVSYPMYILR